MSVQAPIPHISANISNDLDVLYKYDAFKARPTSFQVIQPAVSFVEVPKGSAYAHVELNGTTRVMHVGRVVTDQIVRSALNDGERFDRFVYRTNDDVNAPRAKTILRHRLWCKVMAALFSRHSNIIGFEHTAPTFGIATNHIRQISPESAVWNVRPWAGMRQSFVTVETFNKFMGDRVDHDNGIDDATYWVGVPHDRNETSIVVAHTPLGIETTVDAFTFEPIVRSYLKYDVYIPPDVALIRTRQANI